MPHPFFGARDVCYIQKKGGQVMIASWGGQLELVVIIIILLEIVIVIV